jgi:hypothetical protein
MCTPGGEVSFISRLIDESLGLRDRVRWYSSLLGKLSSISTLVIKLKAHHVLPLISGANLRLKIMRSQSLCRGLLNDGGSLGLFSLFAREKYAPPQISRMQVDRGWVGCSVSIRTGVTRCLPEIDEVCHQCTSLGVIHNPNPPTIPFFPPDHAV